LVFAQLARGALLHYGPETRQYLHDAEELLQENSTGPASSTP